MAMTHLGILEANQAATHRSEQKAKQIVGLCHHPRMNNLTEKSSIASGAVTCFVQDQIMSHNIRRRVRNHWFLSPVVVHKYPQLLSSGWPDLGRPQVDVEEGEGEGEQMTPTTLGGSFGHRRRQYAAERKGQPPPSCRVPPTNLSASRSVSKERKERERAMAVWLIHTKRYYT